MQQPPLLPEVVFARVLRTAGINGLGCFLLGSLFALSMAITHEAPFAAVGLLAAGAGAIELHGARMLRQGEPDGMNWLIIAQPFMLLVILGYCVLRVTHFTMPEIPERFQEIFTMGAQQLGTSVENYFRIVNRLSMQILAVVALIYQGMMLRYYARRRAAVKRALEGAEVVERETDSE